MMIFVKYLTYFSFTIHSVNINNPIQPTYLTNESMSKSPNSWLYSLLYRFLQFSFTLIPLNILHKTFLSTVASRLAISLFSVQDFAPYVASGNSKVMYTQNMLYGMWK